MKVWKELKSLDQICDLYDFYFVDLWGVIHNGIQLFSESKNVLSNLKKKKKKVFFLTNAPRRSSVIESQLETFGLSRDLYEFVISSGEITWQKLRNSSKNYNCFLIGPERDYHLVEGLNINIVNETSKSDIIINTGPWGDDDKLEHYIEVLDNLVAHDALMICSNPDKRVIRGEKFMICAGLLADYYEKKGGRV